MKPSTLKAALLLGALAAMNFGLLFGADGQIEEATVQVNGLACPFCVKGVEKHLKKIEGVESVSTNLKRGEVRLQFVPGAFFELARIEKAVVRGGFTPGIVLLTAVGKVQGSSDDLVFNVAGAKNSFLLEEAQTSSRTVSVDTEAQLQGAMASEQTVQITGQVHDREQGPPGLAVRRIKEVAAGGGRDEREAKE